LAEVALLVEHADTHDRQSQITGGLEVIPGQTAETAGVDRQSLVEAEFHAEAGNPADIEACLYLTVPATACQVDCALGRQAFEFLTKLRIVGELLLAFK
jgi:hypothetical protein